MKNLDNNLEAYADYLEQNGCEFIMVVFDKNENDAHVLHSDHPATILSAVFDKSDRAYDIFKRAERLMDHQQSLTSLN